MKINVTIEIDDEELKKIFNLKSEVGCTKNELGERLAVSQYSRVFDNSCAKWTRDSEFNLEFLKKQQIYCNDLLRARGYLFLNEVYDMLGFHRSTVGAKVGWIYDKKNPIGDNFVDFGLMDECNSDFINGFINTAILDFNVDGNILDYI